MAFSLEPHSHLVTLRKTYILKLFRSHFYFAFHFACEKTLFWTVFVRVCSRTLFTAKKDCFRTFSFTFSFALYSLRKKHCFRKFSFAFSFAFRSHLCFCEKSTIFKQFRSHFSFAVQVLAKKPYFWQFSFAFFVRTSFAAKNPLFWPYRTFFRIHSQCYPPRIILDQLRQILTD